MPTLKAVTDKLCGYGFLDENAMRCAFMTVGLQKNITARVI